MNVPPLLRDVIDFVYPGRCAACGEACDGYAMLCHGCEAEMENLCAQSACGKCAGPVVSSGAPCPWCHGRGVKPFERIVRLGRFADPLRGVIHRLKYQRRWGLAGRVADRMLEREEVKSLLIDADVLVAVPLHWSREIARGYNQAEVLARALGRRCGLRVLRPLRRVRRTVSQTAIGPRTLREENVRGAFAAKRAWRTKRGSLAVSAIAGKHVVVVDDVMTTAATLAAVGEVIMEMGPAGMSALVLAVADPRGRDFMGV